MLEVPESGEGFDYGFKLKEKEQPQTDVNEDNADSTIPDDAFLMVSQLRWEDDVVWDGNDIKHKDGCRVVAVEQLVLSVSLEQLKEFRMYKGQEFLPMLLSSKIRRQC
ncbi:transcription initiation factor TFIID subunit 1-like [Ctenocephalides felis]|uniref:transcription initiation factor TFIID subunit 1-like n=1 Tax=Ctenocephalides felis TaxID=7515 RepID=UPI000E6E2966|nr:transcription initiation factor TFIID subunit 1-like [Ctenocephalides felis]